MTVQPVFRRLLPLNHVLLTLVLGAPVVLSGCESEVIVDGEDPEGNDEPCTSCEQTSPPYTGSGECAQDDEFARSSYEAWARSPNEFGRLSPGTWEGSIDGKPATLTIAADYSAQLSMGTPATLDADLGPFCEGSAVPYECGELFTLGGTYPIHGARWSSGQLTFPVWRTMVYDQWCKLQEPTNEDWFGPCDFEAEKNASFEQASPGVCSVNGEEPIDCARMQLTLYYPVCDCASDGCFPILTALDPEVEDPPPQVSLQTSDGGETFSGEGPEGQAIDLSRTN